MEFIKAFKTSFGIFFKDKKIILFSLVPVFIGIALYYFIGNWFISEALLLSKTWVASKIQIGFLGKIIYYLLVGVMTVATYFIVNWTFVLFVSLIASPFNDIISERAEKALLNKPPLEMDESFSLMLKKITFIIFNELKKISLILFLTFVALVLGFIPFLSPLSIIVSAFLLAVGFIDYSWSRHDLKFRDCIKLARKSFISYSLSGGIFLVLIAIPVLNLFILPFAVVYYTVLFTKKEL